MDLTTIIAASITAVGGVLVTRFFDAWKQARQGRKDEAQRIADERDKLQGELRRVYALKRRWIAALSNTQVAWNHYAILHGTPPPTFPSTPDDDPR